MLPCSSPLLFLLVSTRISVSTGSFNSRLFASSFRSNTHGPTMFVTNSQPSSVASVNWQGQCAVRCNADQDCLQFNFYTDSKLCEIYSSLGGRNCSSNTRDNIFCTNFRITTHPSLSTIPVHGANIALFRPAFSSSTFVYLGVPLVPALAVDGNADPSVAHFHCAHTNDTAGGPNWIAVDLGLPFYIDRVALTNRNTGGYRMDHFIIGVTNDSPQLVPPVRGSYPLCGQYPSTTPNSARLVLYCGDSTPPGRYVIAQQPAVSVEGLFSICEMEIYARCF